MDSNQNNYALVEPAEPTVTVKEILGKYFFRWEWFLVGLILALSSAFVYLRYTVPLYEVSATILIKDDSKGTIISEQSAFKDLKILDSKDNLENEIEILKSRSLMTRVAKELHLNIQYTNDEGPIPIEEYSNPPINITFLNGDSSIYDINTFFTISVISKTKYKLTDANKKEIGEFLFEEVIKTELGPIIIKANDFDKYTQIGQNIKVNILPLNKVVSQYLKEIKVEKVNEKSNVILIKLKDDVQEKATMIVDNLIKQHDVDAIEDKNQISKNTADFITDRIKFIAAELSEVEGSVEAFKTKNKLVDVASDAKLLLNAEDDIGKQIIENGIQIQLADFVFDYLIKNNKKSALIPSNLGLSDPTITSLIVQHNLFVLERNKILKNSNEKNPVILNLDSQIGDVNKSLQESLSNLKISLQIKNKELRNQESNITGKITDVPKYERTYREIQRQQQIKESLYLYLLQKREETAIALAVTVANTKIIDHSFSNGAIVSPNRKIIYLIALLFGLLIPICIIYIRDLLDTQVHDKRDIYKLNLPYLGDVPLSKSNDKLVVIKEKKSHIAESLRRVRTNIDFMLSNSQSKSHNIFVTSTGTKEGKTFISMNLAAIIAMSGKKVLLIGLDFRAPKILKRLGIQESIGITKYIIDSSVSFQDIIQKVPGLDNLDLISSGEIPPNPAELLMNKRVKEMFGKANELYDYVVVDTPPLGFVTDTLLVNDYADVFVYVVRANYFDKQLLNIAESFYKEKRLHNMAMLINATKHNKKYGYGYGYYSYGYGYSDESNQNKTKLWWKRLVNN
ncbi:MAG: polysaccharide biosynthesis tyrosine autokinase [Bacteroidota bacterium]